MWSIVGQPIRITHGDETGAVTNSRYVDPSCATCTKADIDSQLDAVGLRPRSQRDGKEQNGGGAEANAPDFHMAERHAYTDENEEEQNRLFAQNLEHLMHDEISVLWIVI